MIVHEKCGLGKQNNAYEFSPPSNTILTMREQIGIVVFNVKGLSSNKMSAPVCG